MKRTKRTIAAILILCIFVCITGCSSGNEAQSSCNANEVISLKDFPIVGMWKNADDDIYWRISEDGTLMQEYVLENTSTMTINGVTSTSTSKSVQSIPGVWEIKDGSFMYLKNTPFVMTIDGTDYKLVSQTASYIRVGETDYVIPLNDSADAGNTNTAVPYNIGEKLVAEGVELTLSEAGFSNDIRFTSNSSGIQITSGPSPEADKQFLYLRGTLKNTGKESVFPAIGGKVTLDGYEYKILIDTINEDGTPCSRIEPLDSVIILIYAHIPIELTQSFKEGEMIFGFNDNFENVDITNCDYLYSVDASKIR